MNVRLLATVAAFACFAGVLTAADEVPPPTMKERLKARIAEDAKKSQGKRILPATSSAPAKAANPAAPSPSGTSGTETTPAVAASAPGSTPVAGIPETSASSATAPATPPSTASTKPATKETPTVLPKVEVTKGRITVLDQQIAEQELAIARERKNVKASEVDVALNDSKVAKPLSIFGGESSQFRQRVASERVQLMEAERDILEAMKRAKTKEEKQELQKQVDELRAVRRDLEKSLR